MLINRKWIISRTLLVLLVLLAPVFESVLVTGSHRYEVHPEKLRKLDYIGKTIYTPTPPLDILLIGPSSLWASVNARLIEKSLRVSVQNMGHNHTGSDLDYIIIRDLIETRGVKSIFLGMTPVVQKTSHRHMRYIWNPLRHSEGLSPADFSRLYAEKILDSIPNIITRFFSPRKYHPGIMPFISATNGSLVLKDSEYVNFRPRETLILPESELLHSSNDGVMQRVTDFRPYQEKFLRKIIALAHENNVRLAVIVPPTMVSKNPDKIEMLTFRNEPVPLPFIGLSFNKLFFGVDPADVPKYFRDPYHMNKSGSAYFTKTILPAIEKIYESSRPR